MSRSFHQARMTAAGEACTHDGAEASHDLLVTLSLPAGHDLPAQQHSARVHNKVLRSCCLRLCIKMLGSGTACGHLITKALIQTTIFQGHPCCPPPESFCMQNSTLLMPTIKSCCLSFSIIMLGSEAACGQSATMAVIRAIIFSLVMFLKAESSPCLRSSL